MKKNEFVKFLNDNKLEAMEFAKITKTHVPTILMYLESDSPSWIDTLVKSDVFKKALEDFHKKKAKQEAARVYMGNSYKMIPSYEKSIASIHPKLCEEWDYEKNGILKPEYFTEGSHDRVWWLCKNGHSFEKPIRERLQKNKMLCPICGHANIAIPNNITISYPHLMEEWNYEKNTNVSPNQITPKSTKMVWWKCKFCAKDWQARVGNRTIVSHSIGGCVSCNSIRRHATPGKTLAILYPEVAAEWHPILNKELHITPDELAPSSNLKVWWRCSERGHEFQAKIQSRTGKGRGKCPKCSYSKNICDLKTSPLEILNFLMKNNLNKAKLSRALGIGNNTLIAYITEKKPIPDHIKMKMDEIQKTLNKEK